MPRFDVEKMSRAERTSTHVYENGKKLTRVVRVDTDEGWVDEVPVASVAGSASCIRRTGKFDIVVKGYIAPMQIDGLLVVLGDSSDDED